MIGRPLDESKLSTDPKQVRNRLRRRGKKHKFQERDVEMLYQKPMSEWDLEELARGKPRDKDGGFRGRPPSWITPLVVQEAKRRLLDETYGMLAGHIDQAVKTMANLLTDDTVDDKGRPIVDAKTKMAAAAFIIEHFLGKPKALIEITQQVDDKPQILAAAIILDDGLPQGHLTLEGEIVDDDEEDGRKSE